MGAWNYIKGRLYEAHETTHQIRRVSRQESGSPATGVLAIHQAEQRDLFDSALGPDRPARSDAERRRTPSTSGSRGG